MYQTIILGCTLLVTFHILRRLRDPKKNLQNLPPLVSYEIPVIGHTYSYWYDCEEFLKQCRKNYGDIFRLYLWGRVRTFVGKEHAQEVLTKDHTFNFNMAMDNVFPANKIFKNALKDPVRVFKDKVLNKLALYNGRMQKCLYSATKKYIGDCDEPKTFYETQKLLAKIISAPIASILIGEEEAEYDDIVFTFANFTADAGKLLSVPPFLDFIYPGLHSYVIGIPLRLGLYDPVRKHRHILVKHIKDQVEKRLQEKQKYGDSWKRPNDLLQDFIDEDDADVNDDYYIQLSHRISMFIFASVHTTSRSCADAVMDLASRPEYMQELYEEQLEIQKLADENGILPLEALSQMKKLDNFVRESLRLIGILATLPHVVTKDHTFSNGMQVQKGCFAEIYADDIYRDEPLQGPDPKSFDPSRHANKNTPASKIDRSFVLFGAGRHACPGRYLAVNEIKCFMHNAILKYNFRTESGKVENKVRRGPQTYPSPNGIIFEKRIKI